MSGEAGLTWSAARRTILRGLLSGAASPANPFGVRGAGPDPMWWARSVCCRNDMMGGMATQLARLTAVEPRMIGGLGRSVALAGDVAVVGAPEAGAGPGFGAVHVYARSGGVWTRDAALSASAVEQLLGWAVAISGDVIAVGAPAAAGGAGAVLVFVREGGEWQVRAQIPAPPAATEAFGSALALGGEVLVVGAARGAG